MPQPIEISRAQSTAGRRSLLPTLAVVAFMGTVGLLAAGCGDSQTTAKAPVATVTVPAPTVTVTEPGPTVTKTVTATPAPSAPPETPSVEPSAAPDVGSTPANDFDRAYAVNVAGDIIDDIKSVDLYLKDGIAVPSAMSLLSAGYPRLENAGTPPGVNAAKYHARLRTLESFASTAADIYDDRPMEGAAKYAVVRKETGTLFTEMNAALGTNLHLP